MKWLSFSLSVGFLSLIPSGWSFRPDYFAPAHRLAGIGVDRSDISPSVLADRTQRMIDSQTFTIMREPQALAGAERITSPRLQRVFQDASAASGFPADLLAAVSYLESWGMPRAESPAGPKGIMQFSEGTARAAGLKVVRATRYKYSTERVRVRSKRGKLVYRKIRHKNPYTVTLRDDRFSPDRAIRAAALYLGRLQSKFGGQDWAIFAYHCGEGCVSELQPLALKAVKNKDEPFTIASMFFAASPAKNRELYEALQFHMQRDYSPTYWFRIMRARQLLELYKADPAQFKKLFSEYRNDANPVHRADHRLVVWLKDDLPLYKSCEDLRLASGKDLVKVFERPDYFGFTLAKAGPWGLFAGDPSNRGLYEQASPSAVGTLVYIAFETRRLFEAAKPHGEKFVPIEVTELVNTTDQEKRREPGSAVPVHCTGQVFDISIENLPPCERECLNFILEEMGWDGYLGFIQASGDTFHIGCAPAARDFFSQVYQDAASYKS